MLLIWVNCTHGFWSAAGTLIMQIQGGLQPLSQMLSSRLQLQQKTFRCKKTHQNFSSVKKLTISRCCDMKHTNPCDGCRHASTEPCQVWLYTNIKWIKRMGMHIEHCWSHKDAILYFRKKKNLWKLLCSYESGRTIQFLIWTYSNQE